MKVLSLTVLIVFTAISCATTHDIGSDRIEISNIAGEYYSIYLNNEVSDMPLKSLIIGKALDASSSEQYYLGFEYSSLSYGNYFQVIINMGDEEYILKNESSHIDRYVGISRKIVLYYTFKSFIDELASSTTTSIELKGLYSSKKYILTVEEQNVVQDVLEKL